MTKNEIFCKILQYLDFAITVGLFTEEEKKEINQFEKKYFNTEDEYVSFPPQKDEMATNGR